jgi:hypothetical protein
VVQTSTRPVTCLLTRAAKERSQTLEAPEVDEQLPVKASASMAPGRGAGTRGRDTTANAGQVGKQRAATRKRRNM